MSISRDGRPFLHRIHTPQGVVTVLSLRCELDIIGYKVETFSYVPEKEKQLLQDRIKWIRKRVYELELVLSDEKEISRRRRIRDELKMIQSELASTEYLLEHSAEK